MSCHPLSVCNKSGEPLSPGNVSHWCEYGILRPAGHDAILMGIERIQMIFRITGLRDFSVCGFQRRSERRFIAGK